VTSETEAAAERVVSECLAYRVRRLNRQITAIFNTALKDAPLTVTEMNLLAPIAANPGIQPSALAAAMAMDKSTLSRNLARLEDRGFVRIAPHPDGRGDALSVTDPGHEVFLAAVPAWASAQRRVAGLLDGPVPMLGDR
jgi:DNA-binding MarR family transcriptional regulator